MGHAVFILNLSGCTFLDAEGIRTFLEAFKQLQQEGRRLVLVVGTDAVARLVRISGSRE
jgi:anti-anti-sigma factor